MPPKKKKNQHNDFYYFMQDQKAILNHEHIYWNTMDELVAICHPRWIELPEQEKAKYKEIARRSKSSARETLETKFDSTGRSIQEIENEAIFRQKKLKEAITDIKKTLDSVADSGTLASKSFFLIHINSMCETEDGTRLPCELALLEFSLQSGIIDTFHTFIRPPSHVVPLGYGYLMQKTAEESHRLTLEDDPLFDSSASDFQAIVQHIIDRLNPRGDAKEPFATPIYTAMDDEEKVGNVLENLFAWANAPLSKELKVYHVHQLFFQLTHHLPKGAKKLISEHLAKDAMQSDTYCYSTGMACKFHDWFDVPRFCSLSFVKRWAYLILDQCCPPLGIIQGNYTHVHVEQSMNSETRRGQFSELQLVNWIPENEVVPQQTLEQDRDVFGAPKTKASPAGFIYIEPSEKTQNPNKMSTKERLTHKQRQGIMPTSTQQPARPKMGSTGAASPKSNPWGAQKNQDNWAYGLDTIAHDDFPSLLQGSSSRGRGRGQPKKQ